MFFICMFLPAVISVIIDEKINHSKKSIRDLVLMYGGYLFIITLFMNTILCFIESDVWFYNNEIFTYQFCTKYMWISFIISIILPYISKCFRGAFSINVEIKKVEKEKIKDEKKEVEVKGISNEKSSTREKSKKQKSTKKSR